MDMAKHNYSGVYRITDPAKIRPGDKVYFTNLNTGATDVLVAEVAPKHGRIAFRRSPEAGYSFVDFREVTKILRRYQPGDWRED